VVHACPHLQPDDDDDLLVDGVADARPVEVARHGLEHGALPQVHRDLDGRDDAGDEARALEAEVRVRARVRVS